MNRSQRILVGIGLAALAAMASPYVLRMVVDSRATAGKALVLDRESRTAQKDLVLCLIRQPGALRLEVASNDTYTDPASGLAIRVDDGGASRRVRIWLPQGKALDPAQAAQVRTCIG